VGIGVKVGVWVGKGDTVSVKVATLVAVDGGVPVGAGLEVTVIVVVRRLTGVDTGTF
jgi:hypothetical protein